MTDSELEYADQSSGAGIVGRHEGVGVATQTDATTEPRVPLTRERVMQAAVDLADESGIEAVSMRRLGQELGVEAMSLYNHVKNKNDILDGMTDLVISQIPFLEGDDDWMSSIRAQFMAARDVMLNHKWAPNVLETRTAISVSVFHYINHVLGLMRRGGLSYDLIHHALHALGSRTLGFSQELFEPDDPSEAEEAGEEMLMQMADQLPYLVGMMGEIMHTDGPDETIGWCDDQTEFVFALDLILDGLERMRDAEEAG